MAVQKDTAPCICELDSCEIWREDTGIWRCIFVYQDMESKWINLRVDVISSGHLVAWYFCTIPSNLPPVIELYLSQHLMTSAYVHMHSPGMYYMQEKWPMSLVLLSQQSVCRELHYKCPMSKAKGMGAPHDLHSATCSGLLKKLHNYLKIEWTAAVAANPQMTPHDSSKKLIWVWKILHHAVNEWF